MVDMAPATILQRWSDRSGAVKYTKAGTLNDCVLRDQFKDYPFTETDS